MMLDLNERLRRANPSVHSSAEPDARLLERIVSQPRRESGRAHRKLRGRALVLAVAALIALGGTAAAVSTLTVQYFGANDEQPTPAAIIAEIQRQANLGGADGFGAIDPASLVRLAAFDGSDGRVTIYGAPAIASGEFCIVSFRADVAGFGAGACSGPNGPGPPWGVLAGGDFGSAVILFGRLADGAAGIDIRLEDGTVEQASVRPPLWISVLDRNESKAGHRPVELIARDGSGAVVSTGSLGALASVSPARRAVLG